MFGLIKKMFSQLLTKIISAYGHTQYVSLNNQSCMTQHLFI